MTLQHNAPAFIWKRILAGFIDYVALWMLVLIPLMMLLFRDADNEIEFIRSTGVLFSFIWIMGLWLFPYCLRDLIGGRSLGKWLLGIRVVDAADASSVPAVGKLMLRNVTIWFSPVGMVSAYMNPDKARFGDRLAGTMVVDDPPAAWKPPWKWWTPRLVAVVVIAMALYTWADQCGMRFIRQSRIYGVALSFADSYAPLQEVIAPVRVDGGRPLRVNDMAVRGGWWPTAKGAGAVVAWEYRSDTCVLGAGVLMERGLDRNSPWVVKNTEGGVLLDKGQPGKERLFVFNLERKLRRFLTEAEFQKVVKDQNPADKVLPELTAPPDNATSAPAKLPDNATVPIPRPAADNQTGKKP
jgi:uncharacterized RDD family membrane protein YckC